jgi:transglutaminase-like putative cysteine protease
MRKLLIILLATVSVRAAVRADDANQFEIRPVPHWVDVFSANVRPTSMGVSGIDDLLEDHQIHVGGANVDEYFRRVRSVMTPAGVQNASGLNIDFDPSYQRLVLHDVVLIRAGQRIDELVRDEVRIIEKESDAKDSIYDGQLTALLFLKDVRPGDVIDYAWSLEGSNPLLGGRYADEYDLGSHVATRIMRHRLVWPAGRPLHSSKPATRLEHHGGEDVYTWEQRDVHATVAEDSTPDWFDAWPTVQVTEYASWSELAQWASELFRLDDQSRATVKALAAEIRAAHPDRNAQLIAAVRLVQDDIRYLGIEMGRGSHEPRQPAVVMAQRYGDCKDKALLLAALLRELGVEAYPALVNTKLRQRLDEYLPSPFLFDHVITKVNDSGKTYWIDGTLSDQGGNLATIDTPSDERALVVRQETKALTPILIVPRGRVAVEELIQASGQSMTLDVTSTYSGRDADAIRAELASESLADVVRIHLNRYAADHPRIQPLGEPSITDDRLLNVVVLRERYSIRDLWKNGSWTYYPRAVEHHLTHPDTLVRAMPLAVDYPLDVTERLVIRGGARPQVRKGEMVLDGPALHYEQRVEDGGNLVITTSLRATRDAVSVAQVPDHLAALNEMRDALAVTIEPKRSGAPSWLSVAGFALGIAVAVAVMALRRPSIGQGIRTIADTTPVSTAP